MTGIFYDIKCHDPFVSHWKELDLRIDTSLDDFFCNQFDVLIITTAHAWYLKDDYIYKLVTLAAIPIIIDTVGLLDLQKLPKSYVLNENVFILGVGKRKG